MPRCGWEAAALASGWGCGPYVMGGCLVDGARWYGVWVGGLLVVVGRSYCALVLLVCVRCSPRVHGGVPWLVCRGSV